MATQKRKMLHFYASKAWAILEENLQEMYQIYRAKLEREDAGADFNPEAVAAKLGRPLDNTRTVEVRDGIAIIPVTGPIFRYANLFTEISGATSIEVLATDFRTALDDRAVKAIILEINSPGGEVDGTSEFAQHVFEARGQKPIIAYISNLGASAAYWAASSADEIVVNDTASVGSIGVVGAARISKDKTLVEFVSSQSPNKRPDPESQSGKAQIQSHIDALADVFINTVARNRDMTAEQVVEQGGAGGLKVGQHAVDAGLADRVGTLESVISELSNPSLPFTSTRAQNLNLKPVLQTGAVTESLKGVDKTIMAEEKTTKDAEKKPATDAPPVKTDAAVDVKVDDKSAELEAATQENAELKRKLAEEQTAREKMAKDAEATSARVADLEKQARESRFTALAKDWPGESKDNLAVLEHLATTSGEDSDLFKAFVKNQNAAAEQLKTSALLKEIGSNQPAAGSATERLETEAKKLAAESVGKLTYEQAYAQILGQNAELRRAVDEEERRANN